MQINNNTRDEITRLIQEGYNKGIARDANDQVIVWELNLRLER